MGFRLQVAILLVTAAASLPLPAFARTAQDEAGWSNIFNGRNLDGWVPKINHHRLGDNHARTFSVSDGILHIRYDRYSRFRDEFGHLFYKVPLSHYRLRLDYRFVGEPADGAPKWAQRNSGVMIHGQTPESMGLDQPFPVSIEVQLLTGTQEQGRTTANICTPATRILYKGALQTHPCVASSSGHFRGNEWVHLEIEVRGGDSIRHFINGEEVAYYEKPQIDPVDLRGLEQMISAGMTIDNTVINKGMIALQAEGQPIDFRNIAIKILRDRQ